MNDRSKIIHKLKAENGAMLEFVKDGASKYITKDSFTNALAKRNIDYVNVNSISYTYGKYIKVNKGGKNILTVVLPFNSVMKLLKQLDERDYEYFIRTIREIYCSESI